MKARELAELTDEELSRRLEELEEEAFNLRFQRAAGEGGKAIRLRAIRRDIARIKTVQRQRALAGGSGR